ncbi:polysaccharide deacetylase [Candidatus Odyssella thessalonicensis]|uniref:polysaccharide deacetylase n=1 Tax=Candidatus Odyssella thessalonicensis TaxID=84647 RepID=UPI000225B251|nr:polysaccharide deacetylase [Candidatus Odyssella thessalonicensis]
MLDYFLLKTLHRIHPNLIWREYARKSKKILYESHFILSFDCDTEEDIEVALGVHSKLQEMGITPVYAVPGELLRKGEKVYQKIYQTGAEFINHGGREHTYFDTVHNRHASCFFYDQQSFNILKEDIFLGHQALQDVLGITAKGWRTPHFGTFQKTQHLEFLYRVLKELDYQFSTSTIPIKGYQYGSAYKSNHITEIPVTGMFGEPFNIMDTWAYFAAPDRVKTPGEYKEASHKLAAFASDHPILINIYGDPSHIHDQPDFFQAMQAIAKIAKNVNYTQFLEMTDENLRHIR